MPTDYLEFDTVPSNEPCVQIGHENYWNLATLEADVLIDQLKRTFPQAYPLGLDFKKTYNDHDFGRYIGIKIVYNSDIPDHELVYDIDKNFPEQWDEVSLDKLMKVEDYFFMIKKRLEIQNDKTDEIAFNQLARGY